jgi:malonate transporter
MTYAILLALVPIFFVLALGYSAGRLQIVENHHVDAFNTLVMTFALPASLFVATASATRGQMLGQWPLFAILGLMMLILYLGWYGYQRIINGASRPNASLQALTIAFPNLAGVGLPLAVSVLGPAGAMPVAVAIASGSIIVSPLSLLLIEMDTAVNASTTHVVKAVKRALCKPVVLAPALGILFSLSNLHLDTVAVSCLRLVGYSAPGVALFLTGLILSSQAFKIDWNVISATAVGGVLRPGLTATMVFALPVSGEIAKVAILMAAAPFGFFGILFAVNYRQDSATIGSMVISSTLFSIIPIAIAIAVLFPH